MVYCCIRKRVLAAKENRKRNNVMYFDPCVLNNVVSIWAHPNVKVVVQYFSVLSLSVGVCKFVLALGVLMTLVSVGSALTCGFTLTNTTCRSQWRRHRIVLSMFTEEQQALLLLTYAPSCGLQLTMRTDSTRQREPIYFHKFCTRKP